MILISFYSILKVSPQCNSVTHNTVKENMINCGAVRWTVQRTAPQGSPRTPATCIAVTTPELIFKDLNSVL